MTELERFAAVLLAEWQNESGRPVAGLGVADLLDRVLPYRTARRVLTLESSEDYEALVLRLIGEDGGLVTTDPVEAAEMARSTLDSKIPDLDVLRLLRSATLTFTDDAISRLEGVRPLKTAAAPEPAEPVPGRADADVLPMRRAAEVADHAATPAARSPTEPPPPFLTKVAFTAPDASCWRCSAVLPTGRTIKFCVECGADQRKPRCANCGADLDPSWKHCAECGAAVTR